MEASLLMTHTRVSCIGGRELWKGLLKMGCESRCPQSGKACVWEERSPPPQMFCSPGVTEDPGEHHDAVRQTTSQDADIAAAAPSESLVPREVPAAGSVHIPGLAGVLAGWGPCCHELWSRLNLRPSQSRWSLRCGRSSRGREA